MMNRDAFIEFITSDTEINKMWSMPRSVLLDLFGEAVSNMKDYDQQNPHHCYDLLSHTLHAMLNIDKNALSQNDYMEMRTAALFHDIGKVEVAVLDPKLQEKRFFGHAKASAIKAESILSEIGFSKEEKTRILFYIEHHDDFISMRLKDEMDSLLNPSFQIISEQSIEKMIKKKQKKTDFLYAEILDMYKKMIVLCLADYEAQAEVALRNGSIIGTRANKKNRIFTIRSIIQALLE